MLKCVYCDKDVKNKVEYYLEDVDTKELTLLPVCNEKHLNRYLLGLNLPLPIIED